MIKPLPPLRTILAALAYTGAQGLVDIARKLDPALPDMVFVSKDIWCYLPEHQHLVLASNAIPDKVISLTRYAVITIAVVEHPHEEPFVIVALNSRESALVMYGRDPEGYPVNLDDYDIPRTDETPEENIADMDALLRNANANATANATAKNPRTVN